jgi:3'-phosphoadenosine 5'-phosphosulfate sulfotransferase (PAPS reductase)/FAD synthetase/ferredoxin
MKNHIIQIQKEAILFIQKAVKKYPIIPIVSFSGGKDSTVTAHLVRAVIPKVKIIFADSGNEFPETYAFIDKLNKKGWKIVTVKAPHLFLDLVRYFGPPARDGSWCTLMLKALPIHLVVRKLKLGKHLSFQGIRRAEGIKRKDRQRLYSDQYIRNRIIANPILHWSDEEVWDYIHYFRLPYNKLYDIAPMKRTGCMLCPKAGAKNENFVKKAHPKVAKKWERILKDFSRKEGISPHYHKGLWKAWHPERHYIPSGSRTILGYRLYRYDFPRDLDLDPGFFAPFKHKKNIRILISPDHRSLILLILQWSPLKLKEKVEKQILKSINCIGCGRCLMICKHIFLHKGKIGISSKCSGCGRCLLMGNCAFLLYGVERKTFDVQESPPRRLWPYEAVLATKHSKQIYQEYLDQGWER